METDWWWLIGMIMLMGAVIWWDIVRSKERSKLSEDLKKIQQQLDLVHHEAREISRLVRQIRDPDGERDDL